MDTGRPRRDGGKGALTMRAGPATAVFLLAVAGVSFTYACWVRGTLFERTRQCIQLRAADDGNREAIAHLQAEVARRDTIIAERDHRIALAEKEAQTLLGELERMLGLAMKITYFATSSS